MKSLVPTLAAILLYGCYGHLGTSNLGFQVLSKNSPSSYSLQEVNEIEARTIKIFSKYLSGFDVEKARNQISGWTLVIRQEENWELNTRFQGKVKVFGSTDCRFKIIEIGSTKNGIRFSSFAHEFVHFYQNCPTTPKELISDGDPDHANWKKNGIFDAINHVLLPDVFD